MDTLTFGTAKDIITPSVQTTVMGFGSVFGKPFEGVHDDLYVRTLLLQKDGRSVVLMSMDLLFHDDTLVDALRSYIKKKYGFDDLILTYTHTHYAPVAKGYDFTFFNEEYEAFLVQRAKDCIDRAFLNRMEGTMATASIKGEWNISRRRKQEGKMLWSILPNPTGDCEKNMTLLRFSDRNGQVRAMMVNYACHPSNLNDYLTLSGEYPARLVQLIEAQQYGVTALFMQGCGGDAKLKIGAKSDRFHPISYDECDETATAMALRIKKMLQNGTWKTHTPSIDSHIFTVDMPLEVEPKSFFEAERDEYAKGLRERFIPSMTRDKRYEHTYHLMWACAQDILDRYDELPNVLALNCAAVRLAPDLYIFSVAGEPSTDVKRVLEPLLPQGHMLFFGYNDAIAYVPSDKMLEEGGYEAGDRSITEYRMKGKFAPGVDRRFREGFARALDELAKTESSSV